MAIIRLDCVQKKLSQCFESYGRFLGRNPTKVLICSLVLAIGLSSGIYFIEFYADTEYLFTPDNSRARQEKEIISQEFPTDFDMLQPNRLLELYQRMVYLIAVAKDGGSVLREDYLEDLVRLDEMIRNVNFRDENETTCNYTTVCAMWNGDCIYNPVLLWYKVMKQLGHSSVSFPFPSGTLPTGEVLWLESSLGGTVIENNTVVSAEAVSLLYILRHSPQNMNIKSGLWEDEADSQLRNYDSEKLTFRIYTSDAVDEAQESLTISVLPYMCLTFSLLIGFAVTSCMMSDWVLSKPCLGNCGVLSAFLAISTTVGLLSYCGVLFNQVAASMPFLVLGIGLDDMFIMLAAWRQTQPSLSVDKRMGDTYKEAAVSITITSITDILAFCIGAITPLPAVRIFCLYTGVAVFFDFLYQITFFGACMVYFGRREESNRHCYTCTKVLPKTKAPSFMYKLFCAGGTGMDSQNDGTNTSDKHMWMIFFKKYFAPFITSAPVMILVLLLFIVYLGGAIYGCIILKEGLELEDLAEEGSETNLFFQLSKKYFSERGPSVSVMMLDPIEYWNPREQEKITSFVKIMESGDYGLGRNYTEFWLFDFQKFLAKLGIENPNQALFLQTLKETFLQQPLFTKYQQDINFNEDGIESSRFILSTGKLSSTHEQSHLMLDMREKVDTNPENWHVEVFSANFVIYEQFVLVLPNTIQNLLIAIVSMLFVSLIFIPHPGVALLVTACVVSIETGVVGYMSHLGISLDGISMINIILCIGFSIDFSAHISYSYVIQHSSLSPKEKAARALQMLGYPVMQGALSTMVGVFCLLFTKSYIFHVFAKIMLLVMGFGMFHGLVILPVVLTLFEYCCSGYRKKNGPPAPASTCARTAPTSEGNVASYTTPEFITRETVI